MGVCIQIILIDGFDFKYADRDKNKSKELISKALEDYGQIVGEAPHMIMIDVHKNCPFFDKELNALISKWCDTFYVMRDDMVTILYNSQNKFI